MVIHLVDHPALAPPKQLTLSILFHFSGIFNMMIVDVC